MATIRATGVLIVVLLLSAHVHAQDATASEPSTQTPPAAEMPPPPPADVPATQVPQPPAAYVSAEGSATSPPRSDVSATRDPAARRLFNIWFGLGIGDALGCGNEDADSPCAVDFAGTVALAADYRFVSRFSVGLELAGWSFAVSDGWRGQLPGEPDKADIGLAYLAVFGRWYWFDRGMLDPYVQLGLGLGSLTANVSNATDSFRYTASGVVPHLGVGIDFHVGKAFRLGPQLLAAILRGNEVCERVKRASDEAAVEVCRDPEKNDKGEQEGNALAWRFMLVGTVMLGRR